MSCAESQITGSYVMTFLQFLDYQALHHVCIAFDDILNAYCFIMNDVNEGGTSDGVVMHHFGCHLTISGYLLLEVVGVNFCIGLNQALQLLHSVKVSARFLKRGEISNQTFEIRSTRVVTTPGVRGIVTSQRVKVAGILGPFEF